MPHPSAIDAVAPAIERTKAMLFRPFNFKTWMLMGVIAWLAGEGMGGSFSFSFPPGGHGGSKPLPVPPSGPAPHFPIALLVIGIAAFALIIAAVIVAFIYLFSRFRFVLFQSVLSGRIGVDPGWKKYREQAHSYFWFWVAAGAFMFLLLAAGIGVPVFIAFKRGVFETNPPSFDAIFAFFGIIFLSVLLIILVVFVFTALAKDFIVPLMALDELRVGAAWSALKKIVKAEPWSFAGYLGIKLLLSFVVSFALVITLFLLFLILMIGGIVVVVVGALLVHNPSHGLIIAGIILGVLVAIALFIFIFGLMLFLSAPAAVFFTSYALYFFGGRYPKLGEAMWPTPVLPLGPPPPPPMPGSVGA